MTFSDDLIEGLGPIEARDIEIADRMFLGHRPTREEVEAKLREHQTHASLFDAYWAAPDFRRHVAAEFCLPVRPPRKAAGGLSETIIHLHVPKSAGSSLSALLCREHIPERRAALRQDTTDQLGRMQDADKLGLIFGHLVYGIADLVPQPCRYLCVLRQPREQLVSYYRYLARTAHHPQHDRVKTLSFGKYLEFTLDDADSLQEVNNGQTRRLSGIVTEAYDPATMARLMKDALAHLLADDFLYGFTEYFEDYLQRLTKAGILSAPADMHENVAPGRRPQMEAIEARLTDTQRAILDWHTHWDQRLYDIALEAYSC